MLHHGVNTISNLLLTTSERCFYFVSVVDHKILGPMLNLGGYKVIIFQEKQHIKITIKYKLCIYIYAKNMVSNNHSFLITHLQTIEIYMK